MSQLHALLDVATDAGMGCLVTDYVREVCLDETAVSNDPIESFLLDPRCAAQWCESRLAKAAASAEHDLMGSGAALLRERVSCVLSVGLRRPPCPPPIPALNAKFSPPMSQVLELLESSVPSVPPETLQRARRLSNYLTAMAWADQQGLLEPQALLARRDALLPNL